MPLVNYRLSHVRDTTFPMSETCRLIWGHCRSRSRLRFRLSQKTLMLATVY